jgi:hypothetical protein
MKLMDAQFPIGRAVGIGCAEVFSVGMSLAALGCLPAGWIIAAKSRFDSSYTGIVGHLLKTKMKIRIRAGTSLSALCLTLLAAGCAHPKMNPSLPLAERQLTFGAKNHLLDGNNDNFSADGRFLCYDTRDTFGPGIDRGRTIEKVEIASGLETVLYAPPFSTNDLAAPGLGAASFHPSENNVSFIHGPPLAELAARGPYAKTNRNGAMVRADGSQRLEWLDYRDVTTDRDTLPGAHRGGTHSHQHSRAGRRIGFTYDDALLPQYERTTGYMELHPRAPEGATHWFAVLVPLVRRGTAKPGEIERAAEDAWVDAAGTKRAFIGRVRNDDGATYEQSLFVADVPLDVDITTADPGSAQRYPRPPKGVSIRRLTHSVAAGTAYGSPDGKRIAYFAHDAQGAMQIFLIPESGSDRADDPQLRPVQATRLPNIRPNSLRWHPSGDALCVVSGGGIAAVCVQPGRNFGKSVFLTPTEDGQSRQDALWSPTGRVLAFCKTVPARAANGKPMLNYAGTDFIQIFTLDVPELRALFP